MTSCYQGNSIEPPDITSAYNRFRQEQVQMGAFHALVTDLVNALQISIG